MRHLIHPRAKQHWFCIQASVNPPLWLKRFRCALLTRESQKRLFQSVADHVWKRGGGRGAVNWSRLNVRKCAGLDSELGSGWWKAGRRQGKAKRGRDVECCGPLQICTWGAVVFEGRQVCREPNGGSSLVVRDQYGLREGLKKAACQ